MKRIENALCLCGCECCEGECVPTVLYANFTGVQNAKCQTSALWNTKWRLELAAKCVWINTQVLPCNGTMVGMAIECPSVVFKQFTVELEIWENGNFMGSFYQFNGAIKTINCRKIGPLGVFTRSANPQDESNWDFATAVITDK